MVNSFHNDIAGNVQTYFFYVFYFVSVYFTKPAISKTLPKNNRYIYGY